MSSVALILQREAKYKQVLSQLEALDNEDREWVRRRARRMRGRRRVFRRAVPEAMAAGGEGAYVRILGRDSGYGRVIYLRPGGMK